MPDTIKEAKASIEGRKRSQQMMEEFREDLRIFHELSMKAVYDGDYEHLDGLISEFGQIIQEGRKVNKSDVRMREPNPSEGVSGEHDRPSDAEATGEYEYKSAVQARSDDDTGTAVLSGGTTEHSPLVFKTTLDGIDKWGFVGIYSNKWEDRQGDLISSVAHKSFADNVMSGKYPKPLLMWNHMKVIGKAEFVYYDEETGMAVAGGFIDPDKHAIGELLSKSEVPLGMSHGILKKSIVKGSGEYSDAIIGYQSVEITVCELDKAINQFTEFIIS